VKDKLYRVIEEVSETSGMEFDRVLLAQVFKYNYDQNFVAPASPSTVYRDRLAQVSGLKPSDIINEVAIRAAVLKTLDKLDVHTIKDVTTFCRFYSVNPKEAMARISIDHERLLQGFTK